jgi:hypothetical protein
LSAAQQSGTGSTPYQTAVAALFRRAIVRKISNNLNRCRVRSGPLASDDSLKMNGAFSISFNSVNLNVIASDGSDWLEVGMPEPAWEHVSVSLPVRCPTWQEMQFVKRLFWTPDECVVQFHPADADHISHHEFCLHMWRPIGIEFPMPPKSTIA